MGTKADISNALEQLQSFLAKYMTEITLEERIIELEVRLSFQSSTIETLSSVINEQQAKIEQLTRGLKELKDRLPEAGNVDAAITKPPHY